MVHSAVLFNPLTCVSLISYYLCVHLSGLQLSSWVTFAQTCVSVPKFADNCVFREYGIIYYWIYWHFLIVNSFEKMDTRGHQLSPTLEIGEDSGEADYLIKQKPELCFYHFANLQLFSNFWLFAAYGTFLMTNQYNSVTQIFNIIYWLTRTLNANILIEIYI